MQTTLWNIPYSRNLRFTGRERLLVQLHTLLQERTMTANPRPLALSGLGGMGKTQTAVEYAYRYRDAYSAVFWIRSDTLDTLTSDYLSIAEQVKLSETSSRVKLTETPDQDQIQTTTAAIKHWLETHSRWLLIFDNADNLNFISEFLPMTDIGYVLLTTRINTMGELARKIDIAKLEPPEGALFLLRRAGILGPQATLTSADSADTARAEEISRMMDGLPLALDQAGAYIEERQYGLSAYLSLYKKRRNELLKERGGMNRDHPASVTTTLFLSFQNVERASQSAADLLRFCAFLAPDAIPEELLLEPDGWLETDIDNIVSELEEAVSILQRYSLIQRITLDDGQPALALHRLVQAVLRDDMDEQTQRRWVGRMTVLLNRMFLFDYRNLSTWSRCERLLAHALVCMDHCKQWEMYDDDFLELCRSALAYLHHLVRYMEAEALAKQIYDIDRSLFAPDGQDHAIISSDLNNHALILEALDRYAESESLYQQALQMRERLFGRNHPATADVIHNLANLYAEQGFFDKAEQFHWEALSIRLDAENVEKEDVANSNHNLGNIYSIKDYGQAEKYYQQSLAVLEKELGPRHPNLAIGLQNLGLLYQSKGQYGQAQAYLQRALAIREEALGPDHPDVAKTLVCLANFHKNQDHLSEAEPLYQRALAIYQKTLDPDHPDRVIILVGLASFYHYQKQYDRAEPLYKQAKAIREKIVGPDHPNVARLLVSLALLYTSQQKYDQAANLLQQALKIREQTFGHSHPDVADTLYYLALLFFQKNDHTRAESLYSRSLRVFEKTFGRDHPDVARSLMALVNLYELQQYYKQAVSYLERILGIYEKTLVPAHENIINTLVRLAQMYDAQGIENTAIKYLKRAIALQKQSEADELEVIPYLQLLATIYINNEWYPKAEELYKQIVMISERALVPHEQLIIDARIHLAECYMEQEKYALAEQHYKVALQRREALSGLNHPDTIDIIHNLAIVYRRLNKYDQAVIFFQRLLLAYEALEGSEQRIADTSRSLGEIYYKLTRYNESIQCLQRALSICEKNPVHDNLDIANILSVLADIYLRQEQDEKASPLLQRILKLRKGPLDSNHPDVVIILIALADLYKRQEQYDQALPLYLEVFHIREADSSTSNLDLFRILIKLAGLYVNQEKLETYRLAEPLYRRALRLFEAGITVEPIQVVVFLDHLAFCCIHLGNYADGASFYQRAQQFCQTNPEVDSGLKAWIEQQLDKVRHYLPEL